MILRGVKFETKFSYEYEAWVSRPNGRVGDAFSLSETCGIGESPEEALQKCVANVCAAITNQ